MNLRFLSAVLLVSIVFQGRPAQGATLPSGFSEKLMASGLASPTAMQFAPDGRLFICEQGGRLRVIKNGALLASPFLTLTVASAGERGLLGVAFDPNFASDRYVYVYYTAVTPTVHNRISRFTANGDVAVAGSEVVIFELDTLSSATNHNGGALAFGPDGKLYAAVGENANGQNAQSMSNVLGKMLRINKDGTIPTDNPFYATASGRNRAIWALGLRNPFTFAFNPAGTEMFINDVGQNTWEEINDGLAGRQLRMADHRRAHDRPEIRESRDTRTLTPAVRARSPAGHSTRRSRASFRASTSRTTSSPTSVRAGFAGWTSSGNAVVTFATGIASPVGLEGGRRRQLVLPRTRHGRDHRHRASGDLRHGATWHHGAAGEQDSGARHLGDLQCARVRHAAAPVSMAAERRQHHGSDRAGLHDRSRRAGGQRRPVQGRRHQRLRERRSARKRCSRSPRTRPRRPRSRSRQPGTLYSGGSVITLCRKCDRRRGRNAAGKRLHLAGGLPPRCACAPVHSRRRQARAAVPSPFPTTGETSANVWYRVFLTVRDSGGLTQTVYRDVLPRKVRLTLATSPAGLQVLLDGQPATTPVSFDAVVGIVRTLDAPTPQARRRRDLHVRLLVRRRRALGMPSRHPRPARRTRRPIVQPASARAPGYPPPISTRRRSAARSCRAGMRRSISHGV